MRKAACCILHSLCLLLHGLLALWHICLSLSHGYCTMSVVLWHVSCSVTYANLLWHVYYVVTQECTLVVGGQHSRAHPCNGPCPNQNQDARTSPTPHSHPPRPPSTTSAQTRFSLTQYWGLRPWGWCTFWWNTRAWLWGRQEMSSRSKLRTVDQQKKNRRGIKTVVLMRQDLLAETCGPCIWASPAGAMPKPGSMHRYSLTDFNMQWNWALRLSWVAGAGSQEIVWTLVEMYSLQLVHSCSIRPAYIAAGKQITIITVLLWLWWLLSLSS